MLTFVVTYFTEPAHSGPRHNVLFIVLWSDHGWHLGEKQHWRKFVLWEEATRVQFIVAAPGATTADSECPRTVSLLDIYKPWGNVQSVGGCCVTGGDELYFYAKRTPR